MGLTAAGFVEVAERVWVGRYEPCTVNVVVVDGDAGRVVVDTRGTADEGHELARDLDRLGPRDVVAVVNTHAHVDHAYGNVAFPGVQVWGHRRVAEILSDEEGMAARLEELCTWYPDPAGLRATPLVPPDVLVDRERTLDLGDRRLVLRFLGRGHTDHDTVVDLPDDDLVLAGDLVEEAGPPVFGDAHPFAWPGTLGTLLGLGRSTLVPGHGDAVDPAFVRGQHDELAALASLLGAAVVGELAREDVLAGSPFDADTTETALARAPHDPDAPSTGTRRRW